MVNITVQKTPNPQVLKFIFSDKLTESIAEFDSVDSARNISSLSAQLLGFPWVKKVFIGENFISITKEDWVEWEPVKDPLLHLLKQTSKRDILNIQKTSPINKSNNSQTDAEVVRQIQDILDREIQPAVQMDGGFIQFDHYKDGKVYLKMQGACSGCPSAEWTLKQGIEDRLKRDLPQILEVISIN
ncbi:MAG: NifU family protein [Bdellovibrionales bacterium]|nr:NifU family protein [Bdellovibrionales bacterium]